MIQNIEVGRNGGAFPRYGLKISLQSIWCTLTTTTNIIVIILVLREHTFKNLINMYVYTEPGLNREVAE